RFHANEETVRALALDHGWLEGAFGCHDFVPSEATHDTRGKEVCRCRNQIASAHRYFAAAGYTTAIAQPRSVQARAPARADRRKAAYETRQASGASNRLIRLHGARNRRQQHSADRCSRCYSPVVNKLFRITRTGLPRRLSRALRVSARFRAALVFS